MSWPGTLDLNWSFRVAFPSSDDPFRCEKLKVNAKEFDANGFSRKPSVQSSVKAAGTFL